MALVAVKTTTPDALATQTAIATKAKERYHAALAEIDKIHTSLQQAQHHEVEFQAQLFTILREKAEEYNQALQAHEDKATSRLREQR